VHDRPVTSLAAFLDASESKYLRREPVADLVISHPPKGSARQLLPHPCAHTHTAQNNTRHPAGDGLRTYKCCAASFGKYWRAARSNGRAVLPVKLNEINIHSDQVSKVQFDDESDHQNQSGRGVFE
jgi:hypothetical protein